MKPTVLLAIMLTLAQLVHAGNPVRDNIPPMNELLAEILKAAGVHGNFELREADVLNIEATLSHRKKYISYNPGFIKKVHRLTGDKWGVTFLLAHEVGHHLNGHTMKKTGSTPELELEADEFAGFVLFQLGATLEQAQEVMKYIARINASSTHPGRASRMSAIQKGWERASANKLEYL